MPPNPSLGADIDAAARLTGSFKLRSGAISDTYFDKYRFEGDPKLLQRVARRMLELVPAGAEILAGLELGGVPIATAMSLQSGLPPCSCANRPRSTVPVRPSKAPTCAAGASR